VKFYDKLRENAEKLVKKTGKTYAMVLGSPALLERIGQDRQLQEDEGCRHCHSTRGLVEEGKSSSSVLTAKSGDISVLRKRLV
jgi:hypothetical protein